MTYPDNIAAVVTDVSVNGPIRLRCQVCGVEADCIVACAGYTAVSLAYCPRCAADDREPYGMIVNCVAMGDFIDTEWLAAQLPFWGKTREEFDSDVKRETDELYHLMNEETVGG